MFEVKMYSDDLTKRFRVDVKETGLTGWRAVASFDLQNIASTVSVLHYEQGKDARYIDTWKVSN